MEIHSVFFPSNGLVPFERLRNVFVASVAKAMPDIPLVMHDMGKCETRSDRLYGMSSNTHKLAEWVKIAESATTDIVLCDCDLLAVGTVADAWDTPFDIGYTVRKGQFPFNCGVIFVRNTPNAKAVMRTWLEINDRMYADPRFHAAYRAKYAGMNQSAWGHILEKRMFEKSIAALPSKYNACGGEWGNVDDIRIYHVKDQLRKCCLHERHLNHNRRLRPIVNQFRELEKSYAHQ
jgi:hypothetical protein